MDPHGYNQTARRYCLSHTGIKEARLKQATSAIISLAKLTRRACIPLASSHRQHTSPPYSTAGQNPAVLPCTYQQRCSMTWVMQPYMTFLLILRLPSRTDDQQQVPSLVYPCNTGLPGFAASADTKLKIPP
ncbi:unnamed protein product [Periconia digitata]|uniref:Uncharacterized protein n=1 Tax=Periconia digitata TaxID=1303443 RepID=A0A9W4XHP4_9PLEO|nr:unnamed protein product [Periconia digitata]